MAEAWSDAELEASVQAYQTMLANEKAKKSYNNKEVCRELAARFGRTEKAYEYRMQNISHVLNTMGRDWIAGLKPAKNVGNGIASVIENKILQSEGKDPNSEPTFFSKSSVVRDFDRSENGLLVWPFQPGIDEQDLGFSKADFEELDKQSKSGLSVNTSANPPSGVLTPRETPSNKMEFARDSAVVAWVLSRSEGVCECCEKAAPFVKLDGTPFLEIHHLKQLANKGTDRVTNAIAVCPNCHRELHFGNNAESLLDRIYERVSGLKRE